ncbi:MAG: thioredoxin domain-containing protein [bacterium]|nr:thioredoxin domain-containing protein [bacterium]
MAVGKNSASTKSKGKVKKIAAKAARHRGRATARTAASGRGKLAGAVNNLWARLSGRGSTAVSTSDLTSVRRTYLSGLLVMLLALIVTFLFNPRLADQLQANIVSEMKGTVPEQERFLEALPEGVLLYREQQDPNIVKLQDIFSQVLSHVKLREVQYQSPEGQDLINSLNIQEVPTLVYEQRAFDKAPFSAIIKELFTPAGQYYLLNSALVNTSGQLQLGGHPNTDGAPTLGSETATAVMILYSDYSCPACRAQERNIMPELVRLVDEGALRLVFLDIPQDETGHVFSQTTTCLYQHRPEQYLSVRQQLFYRPELSEQYAFGVLRDFDLEFDADCREEDVRNLLKARAEMSKNLKLPVALIGKTGGAEMMRFSGEQEVSTYLKAIREVR